MNLRLKYLPIIVIIAVIAAIVGSAANPSWDDEARRRKADYLFLEAQNANNNDEVDRYMALLDAAYLLDSNDLDIAAEHSMAAILLSDIDSAALEKHYAKIREHFFSRPQNYYSGSMFARLASALKRYDDVVTVWEVLDSIYPAKPEPAQQLAEAYLISYIRGDSTGYDKSMAIYNRLESGSGQNLGLSSQKMRAFMVRKDTAMVVNELQSLYHKAPADATTADFVGHYYAYLGMRDTALHYLNIATELDSTLGSAYMARAEIFKERGDSAAYDHEVFQALRSQSLDVEPKIDILYDYVSTLYKDPSQESRIRELFEQLETLHPGEPEVHILFSSYLSELGYNYQAAEQMGFAVDLDPSNESNWMRLMNLWAIADDIDKIQETGRDGRQRFPENLYFPTIEAYALRQKGRLDEGIAIMDSVKIGEVKNPEAVSTFITTRADLHTEAGDTLVALELYDEAIAINPGNTMAMNNAAYFMTLRDIDLDKAERYALKAIKADSENPTYLDTYAWVAFHKKDYSLARRYIDIVLNIYGYDHKNPMAAVKKDKEPKIDEVVEVAEAIEVVECDTVCIDVVEDPKPSEPISADVLDHAGDIYFMTGDRDEAVKLWEAALFLTPDDEKIKRKVKYKTIFFY